MLNKFLFILLFITLSPNGFTQNVLLQKNNSNIKARIHIGQKVKIKFLNDTSIRTIRANIIKYSFPLLTVKVKFDTVIIDVRKIKSLVFKPGVFNVSVGFYILMIPVTLLSVSEFTLALANTKEAGFVVPLAGSILFGGVDYLIYSFAKRKFDTASKWSFY